MIEHTVTKAEAAGYPAAKSFNMPALERGGYPQHWISTMECVEASMKEGVRRYWCNCNYEHERGAIGPRH